MMGRGRLGWFLYRDWRGGVAISDTSSYTLEIEQVSLLSYYYRDLIPTRLISTPKPIPSILPVNPPNLPHKPHLLLLLDPIPLQRRPPNPHQIRILQRRLLKPINGLLELRRSDFGHVDFRRPGQCCREAHRGALRGSAGGVGDEAGFCDLDFYGFGGVGGESEELGFDFALVVRVGGSKAGGGGGGYIRILRYPSWTQRLLL